MIALDKMSRQGVSMCPADFKEILSVLRLSTAEVSKLLGVNTRTIQRWLSGEVDIPQSIDSVLKAWTLLNNFGLPWRPDGQAISVLNEHIVREQILLGNQHNVQLSSILEHVKKRGGPAAPWDVNLSQQKATLGNVWVSFYLLPNGTFSPQSYGRSDLLPDVKRDQAILEDAYACIAQAISVQLKTLKEADWSAVII